ncbi:MAG: FAD-dependent monooxygenase [Pseudomonadota bacterium]
MILVVGAGIAGLSCALALEPFGDVLVVERRSAVAANAGAGIQLSPNAVKALTAIGARDAVDAVAQRPKHLTIKSAGRRRATVQVPYASMEAQFGAPYLTVSRAALHRALLGEVARRPRIALRFDTVVQHLRGEGAGWRADGVDEAADFAVAADGVGSAVRGALLGDAPQESSHVAWRGTMPRSTTAGTELMLASGCHLVRYALPDARDNLVFIARRQLQHPADLRQHPMGGYLEGCLSWTPWPIQTRRHRFGAGSLALVGDASHAMPPFLAQGGAMALEDAAVLGAAVAEHGRTPDASSFYASVRAPRTRRLATQTTRQGTIYHLPMPASWARDAVMARLGPEGIFRRVSWIYRWDPPPRKA